MDTRNLDLGLLVTLEVLLAEGDVTRGPGDLEREDRNSARAEHRHAVADLEAAIDYQNPPGRHPGRSQGRRRGVAPAGRGVR